jgi:hypothetical protein
MRLVSFVFFLYRFAAWPANASDVSYPAESGHYHRGWHVRFVPRSGRTPRATLFFDDFVANASDCLERSAVAVEC